MAEYINREEMLKYIEEHNTEDNWLVNRYNADWIYNFIDSRPTAEVVPKSEVERLQAQNENLEILVKDLRFRNKELIAFNRRWAKECADLQEECDQIKGKVARKIFEEIETVLYSVAVPTIRADGRIGGKTLDGLHIRIEDYNAIKKKYTEDKHESN